MTSLDDLPLPIRIAALLRSDVQSILTSTGLDVDEGFPIWWTLYGRQEYPLGGELPNSVRRALFDGTGQSGKPRSPPIVRFFHATRPDIRRAFDLNSKVGQRAAKDWLFIDGLREIGALDAIDAETRTELNAPLPSQQCYDVEPSYLMRAIWRLREDVRIAFPANGKFNRDLVGWCLVAGFAEMNLTELIGKEWKEWVLGEMGGSGKPDPLSRIAYFLWKLRDDVKREFDITTIEGRRGLGCWSAQALEREPALDWLKTTRTFVQSPLVEPEQRKSNAFGVNLIGFATGELGIGEDVRMAAACCNAAGIPYAILNIRPGPEVRQNDQTVIGSIVPNEADLPYAINVFCLTAFDTANALLSKGRTLFDGRYNIGWWPWELPVWPKRWTFAFDLVDEIWAASDFTYDLYSRSSAKPVIKMPLPVDVSQARQLSHEHFGIPKDVFSFLFVFDGNSYLKRKNPDGVVRAFQRAFKASDKSVCLVLKTMNTKPTDAAWEKFRRRCAQDPRIMIHDKTMDRSDVLGLIALCDAYVSLHRSEGFGRTLAEAMLFGKPVIGTAFSGNVDFLNAETGFPVDWKPVTLKEGDYPFVTREDGAWWAEPDLMHAAKQLRAARDNANKPGFSRNVGAIASDIFSTRHIAELMCLRLHQIYARSHP